MFTWQAAVVASFAVAFPLLVKAARAAIETVDDSLTDASRTLGHSEAWTAVKVTLPLARRGIIAGAVLAFARALGSSAQRSCSRATSPQDEHHAAGDLRGGRRGESERAHAMVLLFTGISVAALTGANRLLRSAS